MSEQNKKGMDRRLFFKWSGLSLLTMFILDKVRPWVAEGSKKDYWNEFGYFHQDKVDISNIKDEIIRAKICGSRKGWRNYNVVSADQSFIDWNFTERLNRIDMMIEGKMPSFGGAHNPFVASYGGVLPHPDDWNRSQFSLNNAVKGMGLTPKEDVINDIIQGLHDYWNESDEGRLQHLKEIYADRDLWDMNKQISLELYAYPGHNTHSFRNWMENPLATIGFMALEPEFFPPISPPIMTLKLPSYELRAIAHMIHPLDPDVDEYEFKLTKFANTIRDFFHHKAEQDPPEPEDMAIGVIYYICEGFDNYWGEVSQSKRVASLRILEWPKNLYAKVFDKTKQGLAKDSGISRIA
jgi:hypothetical protein